MDLGDIRTAISTMLSTITGLKVQEMERPQGYGETQILYRLRGFRGVGLDEVAETYDATKVLDAVPWGGVTGGIIPSQRGQRVSTLEIRCETQSQLDDEDALYYVQLVRDRMSLPEWTDRLQGPWDISGTIVTAGIAFGPILMEPTDITATHDMRRKSIAQMDVSINAVSNTNGTAYGYIETVDLTVQGRNPDDTTRFEAEFDIEVG